MDNPQQNGKLPHYDYIVFAVLKEATANTIEVYWRDYGNKRPPKLIATMPFVGQTPPAEYVAQIEFVCSIVAATIVTIRPGSNVAIDGASVKTITRNVIESFAKHVQSAVIGPDGKRQVRIERDGSIPSQLSEVQENKSSSLVLPGSPGFDNVSDSPPLTPGGLERV